SYVNPARSLDGPVGAAFASLSEFHSPRASRSAAATIESLIRDRALALQALAHPRPREALRRQRYVLAQARRLPSAGDPTLRGFVHWNEPRRKNEMHAAESPAPDPDEAAVRFMPTHGAKGLESPVVILSGLGGGLPPNDGVQPLARHSARSL